MSHIMIHFSATWIRTMTMPDIFQMAAHDRKRPWIRLSPFISCVFCKNPGDDLLTNLSDAPLPFVCEDPRCLVSQPCLGTVE